MSAGVECAVLNPKIWNESKLKKRNRAMKKDAGSNCQGIKNQLCTAQIAEAGCLVGFLHTDLNQMEM